LFAAITDDSTAFARAVVELLDDPARRADIGAAAGAWMLEPHFERDADALFERYRAWSATDHAPWTT
jgi:hypothetical protein